MPHRGIGLYGEVQMNTYKFVEPPKPVGHWVLYAEAPYTTSFAMYHKPSRIQRWFTNKLLGWTWRDA
jgi:hypothetical protein